MKITIAGAGTWGTALGRLLALNGHEVWIWSPFPEETEILDRDRKHVHCPTLCDHITAARQASLSFTISGSLLKLMSIESVNQQ